MKKKHTVKKRYKTGKTVGEQKRPIGPPGDLKTQEFEISRNTKQVRIKMPDGSIKILNVPIPRKERIGSTKIRLTKKGGKIK